MSFVANVSALTNAHIQLNTGFDQNSSLSTNHSEKLSKISPHQRFAFPNFHDFPGPRPDSMTFQAWFQHFPGQENVTFKFQDFPGPERTLRDNTTVPRDCLPSFWCYVPTPALSKSTLLPSQSTHSATVHQTTYLLINIKLQYIKLLIHLSTSQQYTQSMARDLPSPVQLS